MKLELNQETRFSIGDRIYYWKATNNGRIEIISDMVVWVEVRFTEQYTNIEYKTQWGDSVPDFSAFACEKECRDNTCKHLDI